jgi:hypothetical protein
MSKRNPRRDNDADFDEDFVNERQRYMEQHERRKLKRLRNALRTRNISDIETIDDEY